MCESVELENKNDSLSMQSPYSKFHELGKVLSPLGFPSTITEMA